MNQLSKVQQWIGNVSPGVEIGAFKTPIPGIHPIYVDKFSVYANERCLADFRGEATALPFKDNSLAYVVSSHVLEHVANPIKALIEWNRVLRPDGIMYIVVPDRRFTWDSRRELTSVGHMLDDYWAATTAVDETHIDDFVDNVEWSTYSPATAAAEVAEAKAKLKNLYWATIKSGSEINIHFHVFEPQNIRELVESVSRDSRFSVSWEVLDIQERFPDENPNGILIVVKVKKGLAQRIASWRIQATALFSQKAILTADAKPFEDTKL